jgi:hypothetical protein
MRLLAKYPHSTHPMKADVKKKILLCSLRGGLDVATCIQPCLLLGRVLVLPFWLAACCSGDASPSCLSQLNSFM